MYRWRGRGAGRVLRQRAAISELFGWVQRCSVTLDRSDVQGARPIGAVIRGVGLQAHLLGSGDHAFYAPPPPLHPFLLHPPLPPLPPPPPTPPFLSSQSPAPLYLSQLCPFSTPPPPRPTHTHFLSFLEPSPPFLLSPYPPSPSHPPLLSSFLAPGGVGCFCGSC